jgi:predicted GH43/DUF377 family glycosyl hydrolase
VSLDVSFPTFNELGGETWRIRRFADEADKRWSAFNPSIAYSPVDGYVVLFRSSNYFFHPDHAFPVPTVGSRVLNNFWMGKLDENFQIVDVSMKMIDFSNCGITFKRGAEDGRLFWRDGSWWFTAGIKEDAAPLPRIALFKLDEKLAATLVKIFNDGELYDVEKNWMPPYQKNPNFDFVYSGTEVYVEGVGPTSVRTSNDEVENVRGGSCLWEMGDGSYLAIIHKSNDYFTTGYDPRKFGVVKTKRRYYTHCFAKYDSRGVLTQMSDEFVFEKPQIEFAAGLVVDGDSVYVSYGYKDVASYLGRIEVTKVLEMLHAC